MIVTRAYIATAFVIEHWQAGSQRLSYMRGVTDELRARAAAVLERLDPAQYAGDPWAGVVCWLYSIPLTAPTWEQVLAAVKSGPVQGFLCHYVIKVVMHCVHHRKEHGDLKALQMLFNRSTTATQKLRLLAAAAGTREHIGYPWLDLPQALFQVSCQSTAMA